MAWMATACKQQTPAANWLTDSLLLAHSGRPSTESTERNCLPQWTSAVSGARVTSQWHGLMAIYIRQRHVWLCAAEAGQSLPSLTATHATYFKNVSLLMRGRLYQVMCKLHGSKTWPAKKQNEMALEQSASWDENDQTKLGGCYGPQ